MQRITIYSDGNWYAVNSEGIEISGQTTKDVVLQLEEIVANEPDEATKRIQEVKQKADEQIKEIQMDMNIKVEHIKEEAQIEVKEAQKAKEEMLTPIRSLLRIADDELVVENAKYLESYEIKDYKAKDLFVYNGKVFRVIKDHTAQEDWIPEQVPSLYQDLSGVMDEDGNKVISEWKQPTGGHDLYSEGDQVIYNGETWELVGKDTGHAPGVVSGVWVVIDKVEEE